MLDAFARSVDRLGGRYITAEDVGITEADIEVFARHTRYISGRRQRGGGAGGNPAPKTAFGVFLGMRAAIELKLDRSDFKGLSVAVQGVGQVGYHLCKLLHSAGASLVVADVNEENVRRAAAEFGARIAAPDAILFEAVDIVAPCALGAVLTSDSVARIQAPFVVGAANNQLATDEVGIELQRRGIVYAPDYVVNAGGIISAALEYQGGHEEKDVWARVNGIYETTRLVLIQALREQRPSQRGGRCHGHEPHRRRARAGAGRVAPRLLISISRRRAHRFSADSPLIARTGRRPSFPVSLSGAVWQCSRP